jgi:hypothetical protein
MKNPSNNVATKNTSMSSLEIIFARAYQCKEFCVMHSWYTVYTTLEKIGNSLTRVFQMAFSPTDSLREKEQSFYQKLHICINSHEPEVLL